MDELENEIKCLIERLYDCEFTGKIAVTKVDNLYKFTIYLHGPIFPSILIVKECKSDDEFKEFIKDELHTRRLDRSEFAQLKIYGNHETYEGL